MEKEDKYLRYSLLAKLTILDEWPTTAVLGISAFILSMLYYTEGSALIIRITSTVLLGIKTEVLYLKSLLLSLWEGKILITQTWIVL